MAPDDVITAESATDLLAPPPGYSDDQGEAPAGTSPWRLAGRRLRRDKASLFFGGLFLFLVFACVAAPFWAHNVAHRGPNDQAGSSATVVIDGKKTPIIAPFDQPDAGTPIGPTWQAEYFLGADSGGRDNMVRLLYGGRNSLLIGVGAAIVTTLLGVIVGLIGGYFRGWSDSVLSRAMDILWAFPVILLGIALGTSLATGGLKLGPVVIGGGSLAIPIFVIAIVYIPYLSRPLRGQVLALREKEFVEAARAQGMGSWRILIGEVLPNVASTIIVFFPLLVANAILLEAALSFLGAGVQPPNPSWGTMINEGVERIVTAPYLAIVPGAMLALTVLSLNAFGDGVRDALDPRAKVRIDH